MTAELTQLLAERTAAAEALLADALRLDVAACLASSVEDRLRARPFFLARVPQIALCELRRDIERSAAELAARAAEPLRDLRAFLGAAPRAEAEEATALASALAFVADGARALLATWVFPDDGAPDRPDESGVDLDAEYEVRFAPSPTLGWAWRNLRALDEARNQLADAAAAGAPAAPSFALRRHLPEALPLDET